MHGSELRSDGQARTGAAAAVPVSLASLALAGGVATLLGVGLGRFSFTPLFPAMVEAGWVSGGDAALLGAANLAGYLAGALAAPWIDARLGRRTALRCGMVLTALALIACAWPVGLVWLMAWRLTAGVTGGMLMVLAAPTVLAAVPALRRPLLGGLVFSGIGIGVVVSGFGVPLLLPVGVGAAWLILGLAGLAMVALAWSRWPAPPPAAARRGLALQRPLILALLICAYSSDGIGFLPHTVFLSDYVARGLGWGVAAGGHIWAVFGLGAAVGALSAAAVARAVGFPLALLLALVVKTAMVGLPLLTTNAFALGVSAAMVGLLTPGLVALGSGVAAELAGPDGHARAWSWMTSGFAVAQAVGAFALARLFDRTGDHIAIFAIGTAALAAGTLAAVVAVLMLLRRPHP